MKADRARRLAERAEAERQARKRAKKDADARAERQRMEDVFPEALRIARRTIGAAVRKGHREAVININYLVAAELEKDGYTVERHEAWNDYGDSSAPCRVLEKYYVVKW